MCNRPTRSSIFRAYHRAKKCGEYDVKRLNKALGLAQANRVEWDGCTLITHSERKVRGQMVNVEHRTTHNGCNCEDAVYGRGHACKHMIARWMLMRATLLDAEKDAARQAA
jgi:hypothetical protein